MTSNPFSLNSLTPMWAEASEILKGDLPGHPFHGNQWTDVAANEVWQTTNPKTAKDIRTVGDALNNHVWFGSNGNARHEGAGVGSSFHGEKMTPEQRKAVADQHTILAHAHEKLAKDYEKKWGKMLEKTNYDHTDPRVSKLRDLADAHTAAAGPHYKAALTHLGARDGGLHDTTFQASLADITPDSHERN